MDLEPNENAPKCATDELEMRSHFHMASKADKHQDVPQGFIIGMTFDLFVSEMCQLFQCIVVLNNHLENFWFNGNA